MAKKHVYNKNNILLPYVIMRASLNPYQAINRFHNGV